MKQYILLLSLLLLLAIPSLAAEPTANSVESAGYQQVAAPGALMTVFGAGFPTGSSISTSASSLPLPTVLEGVSLLVNGVPAPLLYVSVSLDGNFQINYQMLWNVVKSAMVEVRYDGNLITSKQVPISTAAPGFFTVDGSGTGQVSAQNYEPLRETYQPNGPVWTCVPGRILILYGSGTGKTIDQATGLEATPNAGEATPTGVLYVTATLPTVTIGGKQAEVLFSGLAPGYVSLWQITVRAPSESAEGRALPVVINYERQSTRAGVTVAVVNRHVLLAQ
ncbi:MAG TPA: hypothetical protein VJ302_30185 [Blastocatellia bacterium]|nr:hypothetical protein [Blastocatellia bacterium]